MIVECARQLLPVARVTPVPFDAAPRGIGVSISAPSMRSRTVQSLAMALHKLTTNAVKYGTPKQAESHGDTRPCQKVAGPASPRWKESGVEMPPLGTKPQGSAQGREL